MGHVLSRKQRAAVASVGMVLVTALSMMLHHYGQTQAALANELCSALMYAIWVRFGKPSDNESDEEESA